MSARAKADLRQLLAEWDDSGKPKTSAYWRVHDTLYGSGRLDDDAFRAKYGMDKPQPLKVTP